MSFSNRRTHKQFEVNLSATFDNLKAAVDKLRIIEPPREEGGKPRVKEAIKGNVYSTAKEIYRLLLKEGKKSSRPKVMALRTKNPSLGKLCRNSARTIQRHIEKLVEHGILLAKARLNNGIQLLLNPDFVQYKELPGKDYPVVELPAPTAPKKQYNSFDLVNIFKERFSMNNALGTP